MQEHETLDPDDLNRPDWNSLKANYDKHDVGEAYFKGRVEQMGLHVEHWGIDMRNHDDHLIFDNKMDLRLWEPLDGQGPPDKYPSNFDAEDDVLHTFVNETTDDPGLVRAMQAADDIDQERIAEQFEEVEWVVRGLVDVKTKANPDWLGVTNLRHLVHYAEWADRYHRFGVPAIIYFTMVDMEKEQVGERNILVPIPFDWSYHTLLRHYDSETKESIGWRTRKDIAEACPIVDRAFGAPDGNDAVKLAEDAYRNFDWFVEEVL